MSQNYHGSWLVGWLVVIDTQPQNSQQPPLTAMKPNAHSTSYHHHLIEKWDLKLLYLSNFKSPAHVRAVIIRKIYKNKRNRPPHLGPFARGLLGHHFRQHCLFCFVTCAPIEKDTKSEGWDRADRERNLKMSVSWTYKYILHIIL